jgi:hypothetical protein
MLDFIQLDGHMSKRAKVLQKLGINSIQAMKQRDDYRDLIFQQQLITTILNYVVSKHPFARLHYKRLLGKVYREIESIKVDNKAIEE